jgi:hypothetical protein
MKYVSDRGMTILNEKIELYNHEKIQPQTRGNSSRFAQSAIGSWGIQSTRDNNHTLSVTQWDDQPVVRRNTHSGVERLSNWTYGESGAHSILCVYIYTHSRMLEHFGSL